MTAVRVITVERDVQAQARETAAAFRCRMAEQGTLVVNVLSSPGAGKTSLLAATADCLRARARVAVLVGDIATDRDAQRLAAHAPALQLTTGGACHLEFPLVEQGWQTLNEPDTEMLFIENIGNLVCPASFDLGEHCRVVLLSTTEGDDKPAKYPKAFRTSHALVVSKCDLLPYVPFEPWRAAADARRIRTDLEVFETSTRPAAGLEPWCEFLMAQRERLLRGEPCGPRR